MAAAKCGCFRCKILGTVYWNLKAFDEAPYFVKGAATCLSNVSTIPDLLSHGNGFAYENLIAYLILRHNGTTFALNVHMVQHVAD